MAKKQAQENKPATQADVGNLAQLKKDADEIRRVIEDNSDPATMLKVQKIVAFVNKMPDKSEIQKDPNGYDYIPISFLEMILDELFFGHWRVKNYRWERIMNEMVGALDLEYKHPITGEWLSRVGAAATLIRQKSGTEIGEMFNPESSAKIKNALEGDFPHLKADCFRNACKSIGKRLGRDLNRKFTDQYKALMKDEGDSELSMETLKQIAALESVEALEAFYFDHDHLAGIPAFDRAVKERRKQLEEGGKK